MSVVAVTKKQGKKKTTKRTKIVVAFQPHQVPPGPILAEALVAAVDNPKRWSAKGTKSEGMAMSALPKYAQIAARFSNHGRCFFCVAKLKPIPEEQLVLFHPEYPLCDCLTSLRDMNHDFIPGWDKADGRKMLLEQLASKQLLDSAPVYQFQCRACKEGPTVVYARTVAASLQKGGKHTRRKFCRKCFVPHTTKTQTPTPAPLTVTVGEQIAVPKNGPAAKVNRRKHKRGSELPTLPPFKVLTTGGPEAPTNE